MSIKENMDNSDLRKMEQKRKRRDERLQKREARMEKNQPRLEKNIIAVIGLILSGNAFILSFTGWFVWLALLALLFCVIGLFPNRPKNVKKFLALLGVALSAIAIFNAVRVSSSWVVDDSSLNVGYFLGEWVNKII